MPVFRTIVCATDFSPFADRAFVHAASLARVLHARLVVVHSMHGPEAPLDAYPPYMTPVGGVPDVERRLRERLERFVSPAVGAGVEVLTEVVTGEPVATLLGRAAELAADLVVVGSHGHGGFERWVLGSVSDALVRRAPCPVLTVPRPAAEHAAPTASEAIPLAAGTYVCGIDFSPASAAALKLAVSLAAETGARVVAANVVAEFAEREAMSLVHFEVPELKAALEGEAAGQLANAVNAALAAVPGSKGVAVEKRVLAGRPWRRLLDLCRELPASFLILGSHGHGPVDSLFFGGTAQHALKDAPCAVLTTR